MMRQQTGSCTLRASVVRAALLGALAAFPLWAAAGPIGPAATDAADSPAYRALMHGHLEEASSLLHRQLAAGAGEGYTHQLLCRTAIAYEQPDLAIAECTRATEDDRRDAADQMWLGRALGLKASHSNPVTAYRVAAHVREAFERAVQLDPNDLAASSDLGEYYVAAPSILGGNPVAAEHLAQGLMARAPARAHRLLALVAQSRGDKATAEGEWKAAVSVANAPEAWSDLALFYVRIHQPEQAEQAVRKALALDARRGPVEVDAATILTAAKRAPALAEASLRNYLNSAAQTDEAPVPRVRVLLGNLLARRGDVTGARVEFNAALSLAPEYEPARKALANL